MDMDRNYETDNTIFMHGRTPKIDGYLSSLDGETKKLFTAFLNSNNFKFALERMHFFDHNSSTQEEELDFMNDFVGYIHEYMAYLYSTSNIFPSHTVISPELTRNLFSTFYSQRRVDALGNSFQVGIDRVPIPDGFVMEWNLNLGKTLIVRLLEFKTGGIFYNPRVVASIDKKEMQTRDHMAKIINKVNPRAVHICEQFMQEFPYLPSVLEAISTTIPFTYVLSQDTPELPSTPYRKVERMPYSYKKLWEFALLIRIGGKEFN